jgi:hypothetical protein
VFASSSEVASSSCEVVTSSNISMRNLLFLFR